MIRPDLRPDQLIADCISELTQAHHDAVRMLDCVDIKRDAFKEDAVEHLTLVIEWAVQARQAIKGGPRR